MQISAHLSAGVILAVIAMHFGVPAGAAFLLIIGAIGPDIDFFLVKGNHRKAITHMPVTWAFALIPAFFSIHVLMLVIGVFSHLAMDSLDWGIHLHPKSKKYGGLLKAKKDFTKAEHFIEHYLRDKRFLAAEIILAATSIVLVLFLL